MTTNRKPLTMFELISYSWQEIVRRFPQFFLLAIIGPAVSLIGYNCLSFLQNTLQISLITYIVLFLIFSIISAVLSVWSMAALLLYACKRANTVKEAFSMGLHRIPRLLVGVITIGVAMLLVWGAFIFLFLSSLQAAEESATPLLLALLCMPLLLFVILVIVVYFIFVPYKLVLTNEPIFQCFPNAFALVKGHFWWTCGYMIVIFLIVSVFTTLASLLLGICSFLLAFFAPVSAINIIITLCFIPINTVTGLFAQITALALYLDRASAFANASSSQDLNPSLEGQAEQ